MTKQRISQKKILFMGGTLSLVVMGYVSVLLINKHAQPAQQQTTQTTFERKQTFLIPIVDYSESRKSRDKIIRYTVQENDTLVSIARKFDISVDTVKWANSISTDAVAPGQILQILPITGVAHKVVKGDTIQSLAAMYHSDEQKIVDYPFNYFANAEYFVLAEGETIIIPDGRL